MALSFGVSCLCMLLWGSISFAPQTGYIFAHGYYLYKSPLTSTQLTPGEYLNPNNEDDSNALRELNYVSLQKNPISFEETVQNQPDFTNKRATFSVAHNDKGKSKVWIKRGNDHQISNRHQPLNKLGDATDLRDNEVFSRQPARHPDNHLTASEPGLPRGRNDIFIRVSKNKQLQTTYKKPKQKQFPSGLFLDEDSFTVHKNGPPADASNRTSQDFVYFSRKTSRPLTLFSKTNVKKPKYVYHSNDFQTSFKTPLVSFDHSKGLHKGTKAGSLRKPPSLNYFVPENQIYVPNYEAKRKKKAAKSFLAYQSSTGKKSNNFYKTPTVQRSGSVSNLNNLLPLKGKKKDFRANVLYKPQKELEESSLVFNVKSSPRGSSRLSTSLGYQKIDVDLSPPTTRSEGPGKSHLYNQILAYDLQNANTKYNGLDSTQKEVQSQRAKNQLNLVSTQDRFLLQNGGYEDAKKAGLLKTFNQPDDFNMFSASLKKEPTNFASWSSGLSEPTGTDLNCVVWKNTQRSPLQRFRKSSRPSVKRYIKSGNRSGKATSFLSKTCYFPYQRVQDKAANRQQKVATRWWA